MRKAVAIDFDNTLAYTDYPNIIEPIPQAIEFVKECNEAGIAVILWTCRTGIHLEDALEWCYRQGIKFNAINTNLLDWVGAFYSKYPEVPSDCRKVAADLYIDDRANASPIDWDKCFDWLRKEGYK